MGYIPPLHYSAYHHYISQKNGYLHIPFMFTEVQKINRFKEDQKLYAKKVTNHYQKMKSDVVLNSLQDDTAQKVISELTGIGRMINVLI
ncbi:hypothetical protein [Bacillus sp. OAE603]|uniref:hypothetical protein n=1 Tax=Gottfriedia sp. OAE603 TaxID=2663872 RepID=UPI00178A19AB